MCVPAHIADVLVDGLADVGASSVTLSPSSGEVTLACYEERKSTALARRRAARELVNSHGLAEVAVEVQRMTRDEWLAPWRESLTPEAVGRSFVVQPVWDESPAPAGRRRLWVEPDLVFGLGGHPSTQLAAGRVESWCTENPGARVLDVGTGTGLLALIAVLSGARSCLGIDVDRRAVRSARRHAKLNRVPQARFSDRPSSTLRERFSLVVANIEAHTLEALAPVLARVTGDRLLLTGLLREQQREIVERYQALGLSLANSDDDGTWARVEFRRDQSGADPFAQRR